MVDTLRCYYCKNDISLSVADAHADECAYLHCGDDTTMYADMTPDEAGYQLLRSIHERDQAMSEPCEHCGIRPKEVDLEFGHWDLYCTQCTNSGAV